MAGPGFAHHDDVAQKLPVWNDGRNLFVNRRVNNQGTRVALVEKIGIVGCAQHRIGGHGNRADLDRSKISENELGTVREQEQHTLFLLNVQIAKAVSDPVDLLRDLRIRERSILAKDRRLFSPAFGDVAINKMRGYVEWVGELDPARLRR